MQISVEGLKKEEKALKKRLVVIGKALRALIALGGKSTAGRTQRHSAKSRKAIARAKKKWWKDRKAPGKV
jgi:hypothetical protein